MRFGFIIKYRYSDILLKKKDLIYYRVIRIIDLSRAVSTCYNVLFSLRQFWLIKCSFYIHSATLYIHPRLDSRIERKFYDLGSEYVVVSSLLDLYQS